MIPANDYLLYYVWRVRDMIRGAKYFDDGDYGIDEYDEWIEMAADPEQDEGTKIDIEDEDYGGCSDDDDEDDEGYFSEDEDVIAVLYG